MFLGVQVRLLLGTISLLRAKFGQLLSVLITLGQVSITLRYIFDYSGFCLLVLVVTLKYVSKHSDSPALFGHSELNWGYLVIMHMGNML